MSFLVFSSATVMDVKNDTMLAVSTSLHGCQLLAGIIGIAELFQQRRSSCTANEEPPVRIHSLFPKQKYYVLSPNVHAHVSVSDL
jgi:hypothetical protein